MEKELDEEEGERWRRSTMKKNTFFFICFVSVKFKVTIID
jgi:hypothetical protein